MEILAIIPARQDSKRLPNKNLLPLIGKPLIQHTIEQVKASQYITKIIVSTDDSEIARVARDCMVGTLARPASLAQDDTPMLPVVQHLLNYLDRYDQYKPLVCVLLQPTSPLRTTEDIDKAIKLFLELGADSLDSRCNGQQNGAIYIFRRYVVMEQNRDLIGAHHEVYEMPEERSIDIDTQQDFDLVERILKGGKLDNSGDRNQPYGRYEPSPGIDKTRKGKRGRPSKKPTL